jgi:hypothetical protein
MINSDSCKEDCLEQLLHELCYSFSIMTRLWDSPAIPTSRAPHQHHIFFNSTYSANPAPPSAQRKRSYDRTVSNKRFMRPRTNNDEVHATTRPPIQAALSCEAWAVVSMIALYAAPPLLTTLELHQHVL